MTEKKVRLIFDTNVWISFLIGKRLASLRSPISEGKVLIIITEQLILELKNVTSRPKLRTFFPEESVKELITFLEVVAENVEIESNNFDCRDPKDNFLLDLIESSKANYLVTGDKDLLTLNSFKSAKIVSLSDFESVLEK